MKWEINRMLTLSGISLSAEESILQETFTGPTLRSYKVSNASDQSADYSWVYEDDSDSHSSAKDDQSDDTDEQEELVESTLRNIIRQEIKRYMSSKPSPALTNYASGYNNSSTRGNADRTRPASLGMSFAGPGFM